MNWLVRQTQIRPDAIAVRFGGAELTWAELGQRTRRVAAALQIAGMRPGARVATLVQNGIDYVCLVCAAMGTGTTLIPLNHSLTDVSLSAQLRDSGTDLLVLDQSAANRSLELGHIRFVQIEELTYSVSVDPIALRPDAAATILYTSGTSGSAKPVRLTWANYEASALASALNLGVHQDDDWLCCLPMYHVGGLAIAMRTLVYGTRMTLLEKFDEAAVLAALHDGATLVSLVPTMLVRLAEHVGSVTALAAELRDTKLRAVLLGGGPTDPAVIAEGIMAGLPLYQTYGMTETASQIATVPPDRAAEKIGSAGYPLWGAEIMIRDEAGSPVDGDAPGIVWVRGPMVSSGYLERPAINREVFAGGWFRTGDRGQLDEDGFLWIEGRHDDLIISGGENVSPHEVERVLRAHPQIADLAVFGVSDSRWGERVSAAIVTRGPVSPEELDAFSREHLGPHQRPRSWVVVDEIPRTPTGKVRRQWLRATYG